MHKSGLVPKSHLVKRHSPPLTCPFVQIADIDTDVTMVTTVANNIITKDSPIPACPTIHESLKNMMTPQIFSRHGKSTPRIHPILEALVFVLLSNTSICKAVSGEDPLAIDI